MPLVWELHFEKHRDGFLSRHIVINIINMQEETYRYVLGVRYWLTQMQLLYLFLTDLHKLPLCWVVRKKDLTLKQIYRSLYMSWYHLDKSPVFQIPLPSSCSSLRWHVDWQVRENYMAYMTYSPQCRSLYSPWPSDLCTSAPCVPGECVYPTDFMAGNLYFHQEMPRSAYLTLLVAKGILKSVSYHRRILKILNT